MFWGLKLKQLYGAALHFSLKNLTYLCSAKEKNKWHLVV